MYAVIQTGGKQIRVAQGDVVRIERISGRSFEKGQELAINAVLAIGNEGSLNLGKPYVEGAAVTATVIRELRGPKVIAFKKKRRKQFRRTHGHRQDLLEIQIQAIQS